MDTVKTTIELSDGLLTRAKQHARKSGKSLRQLVEEGLYLVLEETAPPKYTLPDRSVGKTPTPARSRR